MSEGRRQGDKNEGSDGRGRAEGSREGGRQGGR